MVSRGSITGDPSKFGYRMRSLQVDVYQLQIIFNYISLLAPTDGETIKEKKTMKIRMKDLIGKMKSTESQYSEYDTETSNVLDMLRIHFGDPYSRCWREQNPVRKVPIKMILLLLKLAMVTTQVVYTYKKTLLEI